MKRCSKMTLRFCLEMSMFKRLEENSVAQRSCTRPGSAWREGGEGRTGQYGCSGRPDDQARREPAARDPFSRARRSTRRPRDQQDVRMRPPARRDGTAEPAGCLLRPCRGRSSSRLPSAVRPVSTRPRVELPRPLPGEQPPAVRLCREYRQSRGRARPIPPVTSIRACLPTDRGRRD